MPGPFIVNLSDYAPSYLQGPNADTLLGSVSAQLHANHLQVLNGRLQANPFAGGANATREGAARLADGRLIECVPRTLNIHSADRGIRLYPTEPELSRRVRLSQWHQLHRRRGTHRGELEHMRPYFLPGPVPMIRIIHTSRSAGVSTWHTIDEAGVYTSDNQVSYTQWDPGDTYWSRFDVVVYDRLADGTLVPALQPGPAWDDGGAWDDGERWDGLTTDVAVDLVSMILDWKSAHSLLRWFIVCRDTTKIRPGEALHTDPSGWTSLPQAGNWYTPGISNPTRPPYCDFIYTGA